MNFTGGLFVNPPYFDSTISGSNFSLFVNNAWPFNAAATCYQAINGCTFDFSQTFTKSLGWGGETNPLTNRVEPFVLTYDGVTYDWSANHRYALTFTINFVSSTVFIPPIYPLTSPEVPFTATGSFALIDTCATPTCGSIVVATDTFSGVGQAWYSIFADRGQSLSLITYDFVTPEPAPFALIGAGLVLVAILKRTPNKPVELTL